MGAYSYELKKSFRAIIDKDLQVKLVDSQGCTLSDVAKDCNNLKYFYITKEYGLSLAHFFRNNNKFRMNLITAYNMVARLIDFFEIVHHAGYVYNDLALENIVIGYGQNIEILRLKNKTSNFLSGTTLHMIDFSYMTPYIDFKTGH